MAAAFDDAAVLDDDDLVGHAHGGEAVRDQDGDAVGGQFAEVLEDRRFRLGVHRGGGLVQHQDVGARAHEGAGQRDLLPLSAGEFAAVAEPFAQLRIESAGQVVDKGRGHAPVGGVLPALAVLEVPDVADADVLAHPHLVAREVLEDHPDPLAQGGLVPFPQVATIEQDPALVGVVQAREQLDQGGLAGTVLADQGQ